MIKAIKENNIKSLMLDILNKDSFTEKEEFYINIIGEIDVLEVINELPERQCLCLKLRYGLDGYKVHTYEEMCKHLGVKHHESARQSLYRGIRMLRTSSRLYRIYPQYKN